MERWFLDRLQCPNCSQHLAVAAGEQAIRCRDCGATFPVRGNQIDCVVSAAVRTHLEMSVGQHDPEWPPWSTPPDGTYTGPTSPRTNRRHLSILAARSGVLDVLDWGCGTAEYRPPIANILEHRYVGIDLTGAGADVLADLHSLPFRAAAFDHVITNAVLEHVANPFLAVREVFRVLKPGGMFSGSVAFLEPYHHRSKFHLSPDGVLVVLHDARFEIMGIWPQEHWSVFHSLAAMPGPLSAPTRFTLRLLGHLERLIRSRYLHPREARAHRWFQRKPPDVLREELMTVAGQIDFLAVKPRGPLQATQQLRS